MAPTLDDLLNDNRLARLFSADIRHCALQLWILQIKFEQSIENRLVYGRLLPYDFSDNSWAASNDDHFSPFGQFQAQLIRVNLYVESVHCADLLRRFSAGETIAAISAELTLGLSDRFNEKFGSVILPATGLVYRPVAYLFNRDARDRSGLSSPHNAAGALSASITQTAKGTLFRVDQDYKTDLAEDVVKRLNADTGLDFGRADAARFGDLELIVFPALDDSNRLLLIESWVLDRLGFAVRFNPSQVPRFGRFQFRLNIENDGLLAYAEIADAKRDAEGWFQCRFDLGEQLRDRTDSTELEIFGFEDEHSQQGTLCCRWRVGLIREIHIQSHLVGGGASQMKFGWLEKATRPAASARVKAALTMDRGMPEFANRIGGREADPWVPANREFRSLFARLHPPKSDAQFFQRLSQGTGEERLELLNWFQKQVSKQRVASSLAPRDRFSSSESAMPRSRRW
jgi:hypothetical protein